MTCIILVSKTYMILYRNMISPNVKSCKLKKISFPLDVSISIPILLISEHHKLNFSSSVPLSVYPCTVHNLKQCRDWP